MSLPANATQFPGLFPSYGLPPKGHIWVQLPSGLWAYAQADASGNLLVNVAAGGGSGGTSSTFGAAFPGTGTAAGASDGTDMQPLLVDGSGYLEVNVKAGSISTTPSVSNTTAGPTQVTVNTSDQKILNSARTTSVGFFVKNLGSTYIYVLCQTSGTASSSSLTESLAPGSVAWFPPFLWRGEVHLASSANGGLASYQDFTTP